MRSVSCPMTITKRLAHRAQKQSTNIRPNTSGFALSRSQIFESNRSESENSLNGTDNNGEPAELRRMSLNRCSIADRRKLYEGRSMSVQPEKPASPLPLQ